MSSLWGQTRSTSSVKDLILAELRRLGATEMEAGYSGGNDEGGVDDVVLYRPVTKENPAFLVYEKRLQNYGPNAGERVRQHWPMQIGCFSTTADARAGARAKGLKRGEYEVVKVGLREKRAPMYDADTGEWEDDEKLYCLVNDLLSAEFYTWAGDFSAHGTVFANLGERRVWRDGEMSTYRYDDSSGEY